MLLLWRLSDLHERCVGCGASLYALGASRPAPARQNAAGMATTRQQPWRCGSRARPGRDHYMVPKSICQYYMLRVKEEKRRAASAYAAGVCGLFPQAFHTFSTQIKLKSQVFHGRIVGNGHAAPKYFHARQPPPAQRADNPCTIHSFSSGTSGKTTVFSTRCRKCEKCVELLNEIRL